MGLHSIGNSYALHDFGEMVLDEYIYSTEEELIEAAVDEARTYTETEFNRIIEIEERERYRVQLFMEAIDQKEKTLDPRPCCAQPDRPEQNQRQSNLLCPRYRR